MKVYQHVSCWYTNISIVVLIMKVDQYFLPVANHCKWFKLPFQNWSSKVGKRQHLKLFCPFLNVHMLTLNTNLLKDNKVILPHIISQRRVILWKAKASLQFSYLWTSLCNLSAPLRGLASPVNIENRVSQKAPSSWQTKICFGLFDLLILLWQ